MASSIERVRVSRELKRDVFGRVERLDGPAGPAVRRVACGGGVPGSGVVARLLMRRERRALRHLDGLAGVARIVAEPAYAAAPSPGGRAPRPRDVLLRSWIEGEPLNVAREIPQDFFEHLAELVRALHARGVCHNDLHKEANVLVGADGYPALVDFQLASVHRGPGLLFRSRVADDLRHVEKHRRKYAERERSGHRARDGRSAIAHYWLVCGKPVYLYVTRRLLGYAGGERGRPRSGPWPRWTPPAGPRTNR